MSIFLTASEIHYWFSGDQLSAVQGYCRRTGVAIKPATDLFRYHHRTVLVLNGSVQA